MNINDEIIVTTEKLSSTGDAVIRFGEDKLVIFVKNALDNETLKIKIISKNKHFLRGEIVEIITPSPERTKPFCPVYNACGSCNFQICDYENQISKKDKILKEIFKNIIDENLIKPFVKSPINKNYRYKIQFPARRTKNSKRMLLGYFKENSHELTNIKFCPVQPEIVNKIAQFIRDNFPLDCYDEKTKKGFLKNVIIRLNSSADCVLITFAVNVKKENLKNYQKNLFDFACNLKKEFFEVKGIFVNINPKDDNKILSNETVKIIGENFIEEKLSDKIFKIGATSFFQINVKNTENLFNIVKQNLKENSSILDAYGGVGAIGIYVSDKAKFITLVEENENAIECAKENFKLNNIKNYEILSGDAKKHFLDFKKEGKHFDCVILDPPRSGCDIKDGGLDIISSLTNRIIYVSCNPMTLKRDSLYLKSIGFETKSLTGVDMFPHTFHIEAVMVFERFKF